VIGVRHDRVEMPDEHEALGPGPAHARDEVGRVPGRRARHPLDGRLLGQHEPRDATASSAACTSPEGEETPTSAVR
jgi:hypothetical protein